MEYTKEDFDELYEEFKFKYFNGTEQTSEQKKIKEMLEDNECFKIVFLIYDFIISRRYNVDFCMLRSDVYAITKGTIMFEVLNAVWAGDRENEIVEQKEFAQHYLMIWDYIHGNGTQILESIISNEKSNNENLGTENENKINPFLEFTLKKVMSENQPYGGRRAKYQEDAVTRSYDPGLKKANANFMYRVNRDFYNLFLYESDVMKENELLYIILMIEYVTVANDFEEHARLHNFFDNFKRGFETYRKKRDYNFMSLVAFLYPIMVCTEMMKNEKAFCFIRENGISFPTARGVFEYLNHFSVVDTMKRLNHHSILSYLLYQKYDDVETVDDVYIILLEKIVLWLAYNQKARIIPVQWIQDKKGKPIPSRESRVARKNMMDLFSEMEKEMQPYSAGFKSILNKDLYVFGDKSEVIGRRWRKYIINNPDFYDYNEKMSVASNVMERIKTEYDDASHIEDKQYVRACYSLIISGLYDIFHKNDDLSEDIIWKFESVFIHVKFTHDKITELMGKTTGEHKSEAYQAIAQCEEFLFKKLSLINKPIEKRDDARMVRELMKRFMDDYSCENFEQKMNELVFDAFEKVSIQLLI